jgi:hypothetical protein
MEVVMIATFMPFSMLSVLVLTSSLFAQSAQPASEAFSWSAELVAVDESAHMITVKARVVGEQPPAEFQRLKAGERVMLTWSGYDKYADAIREVRSVSATKSDERFTFPADFVSFDSTRQYVTFKVRIPENGVGKLKPLKPGEWVTATSPHGASAKANPVTAIRPYVDSNSSSSNN